MQTQSAKLQTPTLSRETSSGSISLLLDFLRDRRPRPQQLAPAQTAYVSITGLTLKRPWHVFRFYHHAIASLRQARTSPGNLWTGARTVNGVRHTLTVWESEEAMRCFIYSGAHRKAIRAFAAIATGKTFGYETDLLPTWDEAHDLWRDFGRRYD